MAQHLKFVSFCSHLDLGEDVEGNEVTMLDNSAAKHKMAVRPPQRKRRSESRQRSPGRSKESDTAESGSDAESSKKMKSNQDEGPTLSTYRRTRSSGRQLASVDPKAKRE